jgi:hypothetical protein
LFIFSQINYCHGEIHAWKRSFICTYEQIQSGPAGNVLFETKRCFRSEYQPKCKPVTYNFLEIPRLLYLPIGMSLQYSYFSFCAHRYGDAVGKLKCIGENAHVGKGNITQHSRSKKKRTQIRVDTGNDCFL